MANGKGALFFPSRPPIRATLLSLAFSGTALLRRSRDLTREQCEKKEFRAGRHLGENGGTGFESCGLSLS